MVTLITAVLAMFLLGAVYAYGVLLPAIMTAFHWERATAALPHAVLLFVYAIGMSIGGALEYRLSVTGSAMAGGLLFGLGLWLAGRADSLLTLIGSYGLLGGLGFGFAYVAAVTASMRAVPHRRGLAAGLVVGAFGLGAFVWAPLAQHLLPAWGWQGILARYGVVLMFALPLLGLGIRVRTRDRRLPDGYNGAGSSLGDAIRTPVFWLIFAAYTLVTAVGLLLLAHLVNFALGLGMPSARAAWLLSVAAIGSGVGRFMIGWLSDRIGRLPCLITASVLELVLLTGLAWITQPAALLGIAVGTGLAFGTWLSLYGPTATDLFGMRFAGAIYGALYLSYGLGGLLGPTLGGALADASGSYRLPFLTGAGMCLLAAVLFALALRQSTAFYRHPPALEEEFPG